MHSWLPFSLLLSWFGSTHEFHASHFLFCTIFSIITFFWRPFSFLTPYWITWSCCLLWGGNQVARLPEIWNLAMLLMDVVVYLFDFCLWLEQKLSKPNNSSLTVQIQIKVQLWGDYFIFSLTPLVRLIDHSIFLTATCIPQTGWNHFFVCIIHVPLQWGDRSIPDYINTTSPLGRLLLQLLLLQ